MPKSSARLSLAALAFAAVLGAPAAGLAADYAPPPPPPELRTSDWTGPFIGGIGGLSCMDTHYVSSSGDPDLNGCGGMGGVIAGWNYQIDSWVLGIEGDATWGGRNAENNLDAVDYDIDFLGTVRGRVGWLPSDDTLLYVTGGAGWLQGTMDALVGPDSIKRKDTKTHFGWVIGAGIEHAFTEYFFARLEYVYGQFDKKDYDLTVPGTCTSCSADLDFENLHLVRLGLTFNFGPLWATPVVADAPVYKP